MLCIWGCSSSEKQSNNSWPEHLFFSGNYSLNPKTGISIFTDCATGYVYTVEEDSMLFIQTQYLNHTSQGKAIYCRLKGRLTDSATLIVSRFFGFRPTLNCMPVRLVGSYITYDQRDTLHLFPNYHYRMNIGQDTLQGIWGRIFYDTGILFMRGEIQPFTINYGPQAASRNMIIQLKYNSNNTNYNKIE